MSFYSTALSGALSGVRSVARWLTGNPSPQPNAAQPALPPPGTQHYNANVAGGKKPNVQIVNDDWEVLPEQPDYPNPWTTADDQPSLLDDVD
jgi:hypothetical protein